MLRRCAVLLDRASVCGPGWDLSMTRFGKITQPGTAGPKERFRLEAQKHMRNDTTRTRQYALCKKCGSMHVVVNFDVIPSARIGLWGKCVGGRDYTHHEFVAVSQSQYVRMQQMMPAQRITWFLFDQQQ